MHDFVMPYSGAKCLLLGCDPYNPAQARQTFADAGGRINDTAGNWNYTPPVYPPSTLIEIVPFAFLNYHRARLAWFLLSTAAFILSFVLWAGFVVAAYRPWMAVLGAVLRASNAATFAAHAGQTSIIAAALAAIALWCFIRNRYVVSGIICLGAGIGLKPQLAGIVILYLILRPAFRWPAVKAAAIVIALLLTGGAWLSLSAPSKHWPAELSEQIRASQLPGAINDPSPANSFAPDIVNAQAAWVLVSNNPAVYNLLSWFLFAALMVLFVIRTLHSPETNTRMFTALGAIACIGMLPVYHRVYDLLLLLIAFPSLICFFAQQKKIRWLALGAIFVALIPGFMINRIPILHTLNSVWHLQALALITAAVTYLVAMYVCEDACDALDVQAPTVA